MIGALNKQKTCRGKSTLFKRGLIVLFYLMTLLCFSITCWADCQGDVCYADKNTGIQNIIDQAANGDTIFVRKGRYEEGTIFVTVHGP